MGESLTERRRVSDEGLRVVKLCLGGDDNDGTPRGSPANYVPAAAVTRRGGERCPELLGVKGA